MRVLNQCGTRVTTAILIATLGYRLQLVHWPGRESCLYFYKETALLSVLFSFVSDDDNRILLKPIGDLSDCQRDYINASYVDVSTMWCTRVHKMVFYTVTLTYLVLQLLTSP